MALEKGQVSQLAERLDELLDEVLRRTGGSAAIPAAAPAGLADDGPLDLPLMEDFRVGAIALAWDHDGDRVIIEAQEETDEPVEPLTEDIPEDGPAVLRVPHLGRVGPRVLPAGAADRQPGTAAVPAVRAAAGPGRARLPRQNGHRAGA